MLIRNKLIKGKGMFFEKMMEISWPKMVYTMPSPNKMIIEHTEVSDELRGKSWRSISAYGLLNMPG